MRKVFIFFLVMFFSFTSTAVVSAADKDVTAPQAKTGQIAPKMPPEQKPMAPKGTMKSGLSTMLGVISGIDTTDPSKIKIEIKDEYDNRVHTVGVTSTTSVTKVTDISELKVGDTIRIMTRKVNDKDLAVGIMFGKLKRVPTPKSLPAQVDPAPKTPPPAIKETPKK